MTQATVPLVLDLRDVRREDLPVAGGKAANLGELVRAGFPVPPGFVVSTAAYDRFVRANRLQGAIAGGLAGDGGGEAIREAFEAAPVPQEIEEAVRAAYQALGEGLVAVRSSATSEDLPEAAFAGQHDTFLNIAGPEALQDAVRLCWGSLWTDRAIAYRARLGIDHSAVKLAVAVQRMVPAEFAGVLFTANPVTGARDETLVDANPGLGDAVVSGTVIPDHFVLRRRWLGRIGWRIVDRRRAGDTQVLPDRALRNLARVGAAIQRHFGTPQDVECAWVAGEPIILQARPMTALPEPPPHPSPPQRLMAGLVAELLPARPYPLESTTWGFLYIWTALLGPMFRTLGFTLRPEPPFVEQDGVVLRFTGQLPFRPTPALLLAPVRLLNLRRHYNPTRWQYDPLLAEVEAGVRELEARDLQASEWEDLLATVNETLALPLRVGEIRLRYLAPRILAVVRLRIMLTLLGHGDRFGDLLFTGLETRTLEMNRVLETLAERIRADAGLAESFATREPEELWKDLESRPAGRSFLEHLQSFLEEYGHRESGGTLQVSQPSWKDAPELVLGMLKGLAETGRRAQIRQPASVSARKEVLAHPLLQVPPLRSAFLAMLTEARWFPQIREDTRFYATLVLPVLRRTLLEAGQRLTAVGVLDEGEEVFHLKWGEIESIRAWPPPSETGRQLRATAARRKARRAELEGTPLVDPRFFGTAEAQTEALVRGIPGSPGLAEGQVRVIRDNADFSKLRQGEVLVAPFTNPAWTPLFERAAAMVVDSGGPASHAAIVAREYGIPAVMATVDGTRRLADGERVRVDGGRGLVLPATG